MNENNLEKHDDKKLAPVKEEEVKFESTSFMLGMLAGVLTLGVLLFFAQIAQYYYYGFMQTNSIIIGSGKNSVSNNTGSISINNNGITIDSNTNGTNIVRNNVSGNSSNTIINTDDSVITTVNGRTIIHCKKNVVIRNNSNVTTISNADCDDE